MATEKDFKKLTTSWTKFDIVQVLDVVFSAQTIEKYVNKEVSIDEPILRSFLGMKSLEDPIPAYWIEIQNFPQEKKLFALFAAIFTHWEIVEEFALKYNKGNKKGLFKIEPGKRYTNIRSALVESGASELIYRRSEEVPYDFSIILQNGNVGKLFKEVLMERVSRVTKERLADDQFYNFCKSNNFHKALGLSAEEFKLWLEGQIEIKSGYIERIEIGNFFSIENATIQFNNSKEIYFLGENGDGKSLILIGMYLAFNGNFIIEKTDQERTGKASDILRNNRNVRLNGFDNHNTEYNPGKGLFIDNFFAYGTHRGRYSTDRPEEYGFMSLFDSEQTLTNPVAWLKDQKLLELEKNQISVNAGSDLAQEQSGLIKQMLYDLLEKNVEITIEGTDVIFIEKGTKLNFDQLSEGYKSILIFISDLLFRLSKSTNAAPDITKTKGVVLVDEIDLHLHPKWQRVIISKIRKLFPNIQFVFTTHSPTIIQGASEDAVIFRVFRNKDDGKTRVSDAYARKGLDHLMINSLLTSPLFGLSDSRMSQEDNYSDTSETYLLYRINKALEKELDKQKTEGKEFIDDAAIDDLIQQVMKEELGKNDKD